MFQNKTIGAIFLVAGTMIGAGMLGLPIVAAQFGLLKSILFLCFMWGMMCYSAILLLKLLSNFGHSVSVASLATQYYGKVVGFIGGSAIVILFFSLLTAYLSASSNLVAQITVFKQTWNFKYLDYANFIAVVITVLMLLLFLKKIKFIDAANRVVFTIKIISLALALIVLSSGINYAKLVDGILIDLPQSNFFTITLIFFITFGFHGSIPALLKYLDNDYEKARTSMIIGSLVPLALFLLWTSLTLLVVYSQSDMEILDFINSKQGLKAFKVLISNSLDNPYVVSLDIFMLCAIFTSYFGVAVGLIYYIKELNIIGMLKSSRETEVNLNQNANYTIASVLVAVIPLAISIASEEIFIKALSLGAAMLAIIAVVLPSMVAVKMKLTNKKVLKYDISLYMVFCNLFFGVIIILFEFL